MRFNFRSIISILAIVFFVATAPALAQSLSLDDAKSRGLVGEQINGYLDVVQSAPGAQALVDDINLKRRQLYRDIARKNAIPLSTVEKLAGKKAIENSQPGHIVQNASGQWVRR
jgi:uncharacterized protein YdbL (DUF1318 family)